MKQYPVILVFVIPLLLAASCDPFCSMSGSGNVVEETRTIPSFDRLSLSSSADVFIRVGEPQEVRVRADDNIIPVLETRVENGRLHVGLRPGCSLHRYEAMEVYVTSPHIRGISVSGSGHVESWDTLVSEELAFRISGSGSLDVRVHADRLDAGVSGSGDLVISGHTRRAEADISGSGKLKAYDLTCREADLRISGSGTMYVTVMELLEAAVSGSGSVRYRGDPRLDVHVSGSGSVRKNTP